MQLVRIRLEIAGSGGNLGRKFGTLVTGALESPRDAFQSLTQCFRATPLFVSVNGPLKSEVRSGRSGRNSVTEGDQVGTAPLLLRDRPTQILVLFGRIDREHTFADVSGNGDGLGGRAADNGDARRFEEHPQRSHDNGRAKQTKGKGNPA